MYGFCERCKCKVDQEKLVIPNQFENNLCSDKHRCDKSVERRKYVGTLVERKDRTAIFYVDWGYDNYEDTLRPRYNRKDSQAAPPSISFNKERGKWCLHFQGADTGGHDVQPFEYFFDTQSEILWYLGFRS